MDVKQWMSDFGSLNINSMDVDHEFRCLVFDFQCVCEINNNVWCIFPWTSFQWIFLLSVCLQNTQVVTRLGLIQNCSIQYPSDDVGLSRSSICLAFQFEEMVTEVEIRRKCEYTVNAKQHLDSFLCKTKVTLSDSLIVKWINRVFSNFQRQLRFPIYSQPGRTLLAWRKDTQFPDGSI
jgi:hypothetical protein